MGKALDAIRVTTAPFADADLLMKQAIQTAKEAEEAGFRGETGRPVSEQLARLRESLKKELVAFHERLSVAAYQGADHAPADGRRLWQVGVPLTLFPKRDMGFDRVECVLEFVPENPADHLRVIGLRPGDRDRVLASVEVGLDARLQLGVSKQEGVLPEGLTQLGELAGVNVGEAELKVYGKGKFQRARELYRKCAEAEIVRGTGARWRLDDPHDQRLVAVESHQLTVILETGKEVGPINTAGYLEAYSSTRLMTATLESLWERFTEAIRSLFTRGVPLQAYGEWKDILNSV
jgi:hypothetical protein